MKYTTSPTSTLHLTSLNFWTKELSLYLPLTTSTSLPSRKQHQTPLSPKLSTKETVPTKQKPNLQTLTIDTILTPKRIQSNYFKKNKLCLILICILSIMFTTLLLTPNNTYKLQTFKTFSIHNTSTSPSHSHPTSTTWTNTMTILTKTDKNMRLALVPTTWFAN